MASELNDAIVSLDKERILKICSEKHMNIPANETDFWCLIHNLRLFSAKNVSKKQKEESRQYLAENDTVRIW